MNIFSRLIKGIRNVFRKSDKVLIPRSDYAEPGIKTKDTKKVKKKNTRVTETTTGNNDVINPQLGIVGIKGAYEIIDLANQRWKELEKLGLNSPAIYRALDDNKQVPYFDISQLTNRNDIITEVTRAKVFLNDYTSSIEGAKLFTQEEKSMQWRDKFGGNYNNWVYKYKNFDIYNINEDYAKIAFRLYRDMEGSIANWMQRYGSGESIALIYEMVQDMDISENNNNDLDDARERIRDFFEEKYGAKGRVLERTFDIENEETNYIYNKIKYQNKDMEQYDMDKTYF